MRNCKIFHENFEQQYNSEFYKYFIKVAYGNQVVLAEDLVEDQK